MENIICTHVKYHVILYYYYLVVTGFNYMITHFHFILVALNRYIDNSKADYALTSQLTYQ